MTNLERIRKELSPARRKKVKARAAQLVAEEMTLQELRRARKITQVRMKLLGSARTAFPNSKSGAIFCHRLCGRPSRPWAEVSPW
jgi:hypothetical protein